MKPHLLMTVAGLAIASAICSRGIAQTSEPQAATDPRALFATAMAAYEKRDYREYLRTLKQAAVLRPTHPTILYKLAGAHALNAEAGETAAVLGRLARLAIYPDAAHDADFASVARVEAVQRAMQALERLRVRRIGDSRTAFTIPDPHFIAEGIAFDSATRSFFASSQYKRKIVRIDARGSVSDFVSEGQDGIWMVFGIAVDPKRRWLWAVSTAEPSMKGFTKDDEKRAGLFAFDLASGRLTKKIVVDPADPAHYFDDLTVAPDGRVFLSDAGTGTVFTLAPQAAELTVLVAPGKIQGPNGLALAPDEARLFVSDYAGFVVAVDVATGAVKRLPQPRDATLYGIDGLAWYRGSLIGIQNGVDPPRVVRLRLSPGASEISRVEVLEMNHPAFAEPTLGVVANGAYYYIANSQGGVLRRSASLADERLEPPVILRLALRGGNK